MKLYDFMKITEEDYDTYDTIYDAVATVCYIAEEDVYDDYDKFCIEVMKKVELEDKVGDGLAVRWTDLITDNMEKFRAFTGKHWKCTYEDDEDEFICQWINEINYYLAGYVSEGFYKILLDFVKTLKA